MKHELFFSTPQTGAQRAHFGARGFTLIELMVVLAVVAIVSAITLGGFKEMREGNKRVSCQTNLSQLYQATRLYAADQGGSLPFYGKVTATGVIEPYDCTTPTLSPTAPSNTGIGLWALYTFPEGGANPQEFGTIAPVGAKPLERYLRSTKTLHCPSDDANGRTNLYTDNTKTAFNPDYLSYQVCDDGDTTPSTAGTPTYSSFRTTDTVTLDPNNEQIWKRQLIHYKPDGSDPDPNPDFVSRQPSGNTIVAYCIFHRNQRDADNVLFYDGSVQSISRTYQGETAWRRPARAPQ